MKKMFYTVAVIALAFFAGSCQRENLEPAAANGTVTYTVEVPGAVATKSGVASDGVNNVNELVYEVYRIVKEEVVAGETVITLADDVLYRGTAPVSAGKATCKVDYINNQNHMVLFWAHQAGNDLYNVESLRNVTVNTPVAGNTHANAAFTGKDILRNGVSDCFGSVTLTRPVAQLNIATTKQSLVLENGRAVDVSKSEVLVSGLSTSFNVATGEVSGDASVTYTSASANLGDLNDSYKLLSMNYVGFVPADGANVTVDYTLTTSEGEITNEISSVPVKRNIRTNIIGNLISNKSDYDVELDPDWGGADENVEVWDGYYVSEPVKNSDGAYEVSKASELAWLSAAVNGTLPVTRASEPAKTFNGETFVLTKDIDLCNFPWTPIGLNGDQSGFQGTFDGNGKTISNLLVDLTSKRAYQSAGLFGSLRYAVVKNLTVKNATVKNLDIIGNSSNGAGVIVGSSQFASTIENVKVLNSTVQGNRRVAGIAGYFQGTIKDCVIDNVQITAVPDLLESGKYDNGDKVGGLVGYANTAVTLTGNTVKNFAVKGYRDAGGVAGYAANASDNVSGNTVENGTVVLDRDYDYCEVKGMTVGNVLGVGTPGQNTVTNVTVTNTDAAVDSQEDFAAAIANVADGGVVALSGEVSISTLDASGKSITVVGTSDNAGLNAVDQTWPVTTHGNITFKNLTFKFSTTQSFYNCGIIPDGGSLVFENCKFEGLVTSFGNITYNNCQFTNTVKGSYCAWIYSGKAVYNNCTFSGVDRAVKVGAGANVVGLYENCTFEAQMQNKCAVEIDCSQHTNGTPFYITINNPSIKNMGVAEHYAVGAAGVCNLETSGVGLGIVNLDGKAYSVAHTAAQLEALAAVGKDVTIELASATYSEDINLTVAKLGTGKKGDVVFKAAEGVTPVIAGTVTLGYFENRVGAVAWDGKVTFDGITFDHAAPATHSLNIQNLKGLTLKNCTVVGDGEYGISAPGSNPTGLSSISNCSFVNAGLQLGGNFATGLVIDECSFEESCVNVQGGNSVTIQNCNFENTLTNTHVGQSFYLIRSNATPITVKNCAISIDSELSEVATAQEKWGILWNRENLDWTVDNVAVSMTDAALKQTELLVTKCTSTGKINTNNLTVNGIAL